MSEEDKIIDRLMMIDQWKVAGDMYTQDELNAIGELIDLYNKEKLNSLNLSEQLNKEKEKNKKLFEEYNKRVATIIEYEQVINEIIDKIYEKYTDISEVVEDLEKLLKRE